MGLWGIITGAGKVGDVVDTGLDLIKTGAKGLDAMVFTDEEKATATAENVAKNMAHVVDMAKITQNESGASAVTRRIVACVVLGVFSLFAVTGLALVCFGKQAVVADIVTLAVALDIGQMAMTIVIALFGYYAVGRAVKK